jgi:hypothetical protein
MKLSQRQASKFLRLVFGHDRITSQSLAYFDRRHLLLAGTADAAELVQRESSSYGPGRG